MKSHFAATKKSKKRKYMKKDRGIWQCYTSLHFGQEYYLLHHGRGLLASAMHTTYSKLAVVALLIFLLK